MCRFHAHFSFFQLTSGEKLKSSSQLLNCVDMNIFFNVIAQICKKVQELLTEL